MRDAAVAPVEDPAATVADEDLAIVEVVVLERLRDPVRGEPVAECCDVRHGGAQARELVLRQALRSPEVQGPRRREDVLEARRESASRSSGTPSARSSSAFRPSRAEARRRAAEALPVGELLPAGRDSPEPRPGVPHEQPAPRRIGRDDLAHAVGRRPGELAGERDLEAVDGDRRLEPQVAADVGTRRTVDHGRTCGCSTPPVRPAGRFASTQAIAVRSHSDPPSA